MLFLIVFSLPFIGGGAAAMYFLSIAPVYRTYVSADWPRVPCRIYHSDVKSHSDDDGTTYSVDIHFEYEFEGRQFTSTTYNFDSSSSSGYDSKKAIVDRYPVGSEHECYVNPDFPEQAVLNREFQWTYLLGFAFGGIFGGVGLVLLIWGVTSAVRGPRAKRSLSSSHRAKKVESMFAEGLLQTEETQGPLKLKTQGGPILQFIGVTVVAAFWNGIVGVFVYQVVDSYRDGDPQIFLTIFLIPFVLIGLVLIGGVVYTFLQIFNPRPQLELADGNVRLGSSTTLSWTMSGSAQSISKLTIRLIGQEWAQYRVGTNTHTDTKAFERILVFETEERTAMRHGEVVLSIPEFTMHSFEATSNKIEWFIEVHGDVKRWPDIKAKFPITVRPLGSGS